MRFKQLFQKQNAAQETEYFIKKEELRQGVCRGKKKQTTKPNQNKPQKNLYTKPTVVFSQGTFSAFEVKCQRQ